VFQTDAIFVLFVPVWEYPRRVHITLFIRDILGEFLFEIEVMEQWSRMQLGRRRNLSSNPGICSPLYAPCNERI
jgi:hypothetical protein